MMKSNTIFQVTLWVKKISFSVMFLFIKYKNSDEMPTINAMMKSSKIRDLFIHMHEVLCFLLYIYIASIITA